MSEIWRDGVVPFVQRLVEENSVFDGLLHGFGGISSGFVESFDDVDGCFQAGGCGCLFHEIHRAFESIEQHPCAGATHVRKETPFNEIVFRTVARIVRHTDLDADFIHNSLQVVFENVLRGGVTSATIRQQQNRIRIGITLSPDPIPVPLETVAGKLSRVT